jgi:1-aminocyclopropane-1-carboxylate deaminase
MENFKNIIELQNVTIEPIKLDILSEKKGCQADILRLDKIHPVISGNKWFKLKYHLEYANQNGFKTILTFGGYYSNHIVATALAAKNAGLKSIGVIRGERPKQISHTLKDAEEYGMQLVFISREDYKRKETENYEKFGNPYIIPEGGAGLLGIKGCKEILSLTDVQNYSHILCATGTGTMYFGIVNSSTPGQKIIGVPVLKGMNNFIEQNSHLFKNQEKKADCLIFPDYHFGGYANANNNFPV